mmetsp:Transcript_15034/g.26514  ORF Transcript_15034/g.26514 Transcript_15034/m.26514 type:complete len:581 (-) Transcript_15034:130-1872(-)
MATDEEGDAVMGDAPAQDRTASETTVKASGEADGAAPSAEPSATGTEAAEKKEEDKKEEETKEPEPSPEERVTGAEAAKEAGNALLKAGDMAGAVAKYAEGIALAEPMLEKDPSKVGEEWQQRGSKAYLALRLNSAQACIKQSEWASATEHADRVLLIDKENAKALYRRALASMQFESESRLEQARTDLAQLVQIEPANREARQNLQVVKDRLRTIKQQEKERYAKSLTGGLYKEQHDKLARLKLQYEEEVKRRKEASEDEISWEDWQKKIKEKEDEAKKQEKEAREKRAKEAAQEEEQRRLKEDNEKRKAEGLEELSLEDWRAAQASTRKEEVVKTDDLDLDEEEKKMLQEQKAKGYYHGRLNTVLSDAAPKPQQLAADSELAKDAGGSPEKQLGSEWNQAGTWEEKDTTSWVKERLTAWLKSAKVTHPGVSLPSGEVVSVSAEVRQVKSCTGEAQRVMVRKQPRYGYTFEAELSFRLTLTPASSAEKPAEEDKEEEEEADADASKKPAASKATRYDGTFSVPELADFVQPKDLRIEAKWKGSAPPADKLSTAVEWLEKLKDSLREQVSAFVKEYREQG